MKKFFLRFLFPALTLLFILFIFSNSIRTAAESSEESGRLISWLVSVFPFLKEKISQFLIRKTAHFCEFFVLGMLFGLAERLSFSDWHTEGKKKLFIHTGLFLMAIPVIDETIQRFVPGRSGEARDVLIDLVGGTLGFLMILLFTRKKKNTYH